jgi:hypothetical protein
MRFLLYLFTFYFLYDIAYAQLINPLYAPELYMRSCHISNSDFGLTKFGTAYCTKGVLSTDFVECDECNDCYNCDGGTENVSAETCTGGSNYQYGWDICSMMGASHNTYGFAVYRLEYLNNQGLTRCIYIDFRDNDYSLGYLIVTGYSTDLYIEYDHLGFTNAGYYKWKFPYQTEWMEIPDNGILQIWKGVGRVSPRTNDFPLDFWSKCLVIGYQPPTSIRFYPLQLIWSKNPNQTNILKYYLYRKIDNGNFIRIGEFNNQTFNYSDKALVYDTYSPSHTVSYKVSSFNGSESFTDVEIEEYISCDWNNGLILTNNGTHPKLVWVPNPNFNATSYRIYRAVSNNPVNPLSLNYSLISSVSSSTFEYTDYAVTILPGYQYAYYYVVGYNGSSESSKTNYVSTPAEFHKQLPVELLNEYTLLQNYPNPFNPSTKISYSIKEEGLVTLKVYDILGKEIATLVNENKPSGNYEAEFNASALPSGMYIYKLQAGNFTDVKKMLLLK